MESLVTEGEGYTLALKHDLESLVEQLRTVPEVQKVILFGLQEQGVSP